MKELLILFLGFSMGKSQSSTALPLNISIEETKDAYINGTIQYVLDIVGIKMCASQCFRETNCSGFNYEPRMIRCELLLGDLSSQAVPDSVYSYSTKDTWTGFDGPCESDPCTESNQRCVSRGSKRFCIVPECISFPDAVVRHSTINSTAVNTARSVGSIFTYACLDGFKRIGNANISCQPDLTFKLPAQLPVCYRVYGDLTLVGRFTSGINVSVYDTWSTPGINSDADQDIEDECFSIETSVSCQHHYRSGIVDKWQQSGVQEVKIALYKNGIEEAYITFAAAGTTYLDWFNPSTILSASWFDMTSPYLFSMAGLGGPISRSFGISHEYGVCSTDAGWLFIIEDEGFCDYDNLAPFPYFLYAPESYAASFGSEAELADVFAIFLKI